MLTRLGVAGWPVSHSRSPAMHNAALAALGLDDWRYQALPIPPREFAATVRALPASGFAGINVTVPHKAAALDLADEATPRARAIGAANTLSFDAGGAIVADNTDAPGLLAALARARPRSALILGAGGSARAAAWALREAGARVRVHNRTRVRAEALAAALGVELADALDGQSADVLVHCTTVGLDDARALAIDPKALGGFGLVCDLVYRAGGTALTRAAAKRGIPVVDGLEVLVHQGALSLETWTGRQAPLDVMRAAAADAS